MEEWQIRSTLIIGKRLNVFTIWLLLIGFSFVDASYVGE